MGTPLILAALSLVFLATVFVASFWFLKRINQSDPRRQVIGRTDLTPQERYQLARRIEREALRARREQAAINQRGALDTARPSYYQDKLKKREEERLAREQAEFEANRIKQQAELAQYDQWKTTISITSEGCEKGDIVSVEQFIEYIQENRIVNIEQVASIFSLTPDQVISRISDLENYGKLFGNLDERGKYTVIMGDQITSLNVALETFGDRWNIDALRHLVSRCMK
jgi:hypothetical protein